MEFLRYRRKSITTARVVLWGRTSGSLFQQSEHKSKEPLDLVHSDVCGPMSVHSFSGYSYYVTFIDDYSRKTWIYFLKAKSEVFERFREFKSLVENQI